MLLFSDTQHFYHLSPCKKKILLHPLGSSLHIIGHLLVVPALRCLSLDLLINDYSLQIAWWFGNSISIAPTVHFPFVFLLLWADKLLYRYFGKMIDLLIWRYYYWLSFTSFLLQGFAVNTNSVFCGRTWVYAGVTHMHIDKDYLSSYKVLHAPLKKMKTLFTIFKFLFSETRWHNRS